MSSAAFVSLVSRKARRLQTGLPQNICMRKAKSRACSCSVYLECKYHTLWKLPGASSSRDLDKEESGAGVAVAPMPTQADTAKLLCLSVW